MRQGLWPLGLEGVTLAAVCDLDISKARSAAERHGAKSVYASAADLLDSGDIDFVCRIWFERAAPSFPWRYTRSIAIVVRSTDDRRQSSKARAASRRYTGAKQLWKGGASSAQRFVSGRSPNCANSPRDFRAQPASFVFA
jgi:hypothetical protein